jgi:general L-amino acid transport system substrate-binding protein
MMAAVALLCALSSAQAGARLDAIRARGTLNCGVAINEPGMALRDAKGNYTGFEADFCRAVAIAIFGTPKVAFKPTTTLQDFLRSDEIDVVFRGLSWTYARETAANIRFGPVYLHDGQTFLVRSNAPVQRLADLSRRSICVSSDRFADFYPPLERSFRANGIALNAQRLHTRAEAEQAFFAGKCDAVTADATELAVAVNAKRAAPGTYRILPEQITKEPLAPLLRKGDDQFFDIVRWAVFAPIAAEELGITRTNLDSVRSSRDPDIAAFFAPPPPGSPLAPGWSAAVIRILGNYGEMFSRHLGAGSPAGLPRGLNRLPAQGGILYAPPLR